MVRRRPDGARAPRSQRSPPSLMLGMMVGGQRIFRAAEDSVVTMWRVAAGVPRVPHCGVDAPMSRVAVRRNYLIAPVMGLVWVLH